MAGYRTDRAADETGFMGNGVIHFSSNL
ncbi:hypothetical protein AGR13a_Cc20176 [Agrobacterium genomosp. 13 str. CFBP 6927]|uniref:Uncharacterized protein n=1 Tax=Agrobacterium genomosp. 13 str. CFBP 6927 TaxID=1183428 RepID=A0ABM9VCS4_9HYPH|nr:hypothetical protein AGR13a_Cc20176 [Agrobacterium genomosp. 13 str. CFBP 6927]